MLALELVPAWQEIPGITSASGKDGGGVSDGSGMDESLEPLTLGLVPDQNAEVAKPFGFQVPDGVTSGAEGVSLSASLADGSPLPSWLKNLIQTRNRSQGHPLKRLSLASR